MNEYIITRADQYVVLSQGQVQWTRTHSFASVFKNKHRADKVAAFVGGAVQPFYGAVVKSTKSTVMPKQNDRNKRAAYRSI